MRRMGRWASWLVVADQSRVPGPAPGRGGGTARVRCPSAAWLSGRACLPSQRPGRRLYRSSGHGQPSMAVSAAGRPWSSARCAPASAVPVESVVVQHRAVTVQHRAGRDARRGDGRGEWRWIVGGRAVGVEVVGILGLVVVVVVCPALCCSAPAPGGCCWQRPGSRVPTTAGARSGAVGARPKRFLNVPAPWW